MLKPLDPPLVRVPIDRARRLDWRQIGLAAAAIALLALLYAPVARTLVAQWWTNDKYSHGFLIPAVSLYLVWVRRARLLAAPWAPRYVAGSAVLAAGLGMLAVGRAAGVQDAEQLSLLVTGGGIVTLLAGPAVLRLLAFPLAYLLLMLPSWEIVTGQLHRPFQLVSAWAATGMLGAVGIPAYRQGQFIELPGVLLDVTEGCSGVNYLVAVVAIGIPMAALFLRGWRRRLLLVAFGLLVAILANWARVAVIGVLAYNGFSSHGPYHVMQAMSVAVLGYAAIFAGLWALSTNQGARREAPSPGTPDRDATTGPEARGPHVPAAALGVALTLLGAATLHVQYGAPRPVPLRLDLRALPYVLGPWQGRDAPAVYDGYRALGIDREVSRVYRLPSGETVRLYVGYFERQEQGRELVNFATRDLTGDTRRVLVPLTPRGSVEANRIARDEPRQTLLVWYEVNGRRLADQRLVKLYTALDAVARRRSNGAVVIIAGDVDGGDEEAALRAMHGFVGELVTRLPAYLPGAV